MRKKLLALSFIEGSAVMAAELCGARLLAPIFGSSLFVWASVMGITLSALGGGYFFGAFLSGRNQYPERSLFRVLSVAALFLVLMPVLSYYLIPRISYLPFIPAAILGTITLLFAPVVLLGASSPLFIAAQTAAGRDAGKISGTVYAVSTAGGILSTFVCGFYFIPLLGINVTMLFFGVVLFLASFILLGRFSAGQIFFLLAIGYLNLQMMFVPDNAKWSSDSILGRLQVKDIPAGTDTVRILTINDIIQTEMSFRTGRSVSEYVKLLDTLCPPVKRPEKALVLGLGGGLSANMLAHKGYEVTGVEFDERIISAAKEYFFLDPHINTVNDDARYFLNQMNGKYSVVIADLYKAEETPAHVFTLESLLTLRKNLQDSGLLLIGWHGFASGVKGEGTAVLYNTLKKAGYVVEICSFSDDELSRNLVFVASKTRLQKNAFFIKQQLPELSRVNTDATPCLEKFNAEANKAWRVQYLRYYQGQK
jgi:predicted membrane-bound spermidine synthase